MQQTRAHETANAEPTQHPPDLAPEEKAQELELFEQMTRSALQTIVDTEQNA